MDAILRDEHRPQLLLVDDDRLFCQVLGEALADRGYRVSVAHDVDTALEAAKATEPEYAVIDLRIGRGSGLALVKALRGLDAHTRMIILTGYASIATAVEAIKLGAVHYLTKPADADEIVAALHRADGDAGAPIADSPPTLRRLEWEHLQRVLGECGGNISEAARRLRMHRRTLQRKLAKRPVRE